MSVLPQLKLKKHKEWEKTRVPTTPANQIQKSLFKIKKHTSRRPDKLYYGIILRKMNSFPEKLYYGKNTTLRGQKTWDLVSNCALGLVLTPFRPQLSPWEKF